MSKLSIMSAVTQKLASTTKTGVVVSAGLMNKCVKVRIAGQEWNKAVRKHFPSSKTYLVSDPNASLREGDVVRIASGWAVSKRIRHVVTSIVAPFGTPVSERPPVPTEEERVAYKERGRIMKDVRQAAKGRWTAQMRLKEWEKMGKEIPTLEEAMGSRGLEALEDAGEHKKLGAAEVQAKLERLRREDQEKAQATTRPQKRKNK